MRIKLILLLLLCVFASCTTQESKDKAVTPPKAKHNILSKIPSQYIDWYMGNSESIILYDFVEYPYSTERSLHIKERNTEDNTIMLNDEIGLQIHDSYTLDNDGKVAHFHITREAKVVFPKQGIKPRCLTRDGYPADPPTYDIDVQMVEPIYILRPNSTQCHCIPMCYYDEMEIEWNPDINNSNGVMIIAEWNGVTMNGTSSETETIIGIDFVEDNGVATLDNAIFEGMPDEALVNLWLLRANVVTVEEIGVGYIDDIIQWGLEDPDLVAELLEDNPEFISDIQTMVLASGAVALLPIYLIRNL